LHCVAVCCSVLQCVAVCCSVLQCVAVRCSQEYQAWCIVLQCVARRSARRGAVCGSVLQCVAVCCSVLQWDARRSARRGALCFSVLQCVVVCCSVLQCVAVFCSESLAGIPGVAETLTGLSRHDSFTCVKWLSHMCNMSHSYVRHDSFIRETGLRDMTHSQM